MAPLFNTSKANNTLVRALLTVKTKEKGLPNKGTVQVI